MYTIGIDLGGTNIVASVVDDDYNIIGTSKTPTNSPRSADEIFDDIADVCEEAVKAADLTMEDIDSVGMGTPGTVNQDGIIEFEQYLQHGYLRILFMADFKIDFQLLSQQSITTSAWPT